MDPVPLTERHDQGVESRRVLAVGLAADGLLGLFKLLAGVAGGSAALAADGLQSLAERAALWLERLLGRPTADESFAPSRQPSALDPERLIPLLAAIALLAAALGIVAEAVQRLIRPAALIPGYWTLGAALLALAAKEILFQFTSRASARWMLPALHGEAWRHRFEALPTLTALAGIVGALAGWPASDPLAAVIVAFILAKTGLELFHKVIHRLTGAHNAIRQELETRCTFLAGQSPELRSGRLSRIHALEDGSLLAEVRAVANPMLSASEGRQLADRLRTALLAESEVLHDAVIHLDVVDDPEARALPILESREALQRRVNAALRDFPEFSGCSRLTPYYSPEGIQLDLALTPAPGLSLETLRKAAAEAAERLEHEGVAHASVFLDPHETDNAP
ncbi:MAG: cation diffusion facilitator family transporter [Magnetococcales bacterium]|nr:cation diffusion facilitator family transporter [Magnetococcales bacterium]